MERSVFIRGILCALFGGFFWGFSASCAEFILHSYELSPLYVTWARTLGAGLLFLGVLLITQRKRFGAMLHDIRSLKKLLIFSVIGMTGTQLAYITSIGSTNAGIATVLQCLEIVFIMAYTSIVFRKKPSQRDVIGFVLAFTSVFIIATHGDPAQLHIPLVGLLWGLANAGFSAFLTTYPKELLARWGSLVVVGSGMLVSGVLLTCVVQPWTVAVDLDLQGWLALTALIFLGTFMAFLLFFQAVKDVGPVKTALLVTVEPISATFISWAWLGTSFTVYDLVGFTLMLVMLFVVTKIPQKK